MRIHKEELSLSKPPPKAPKAKDGNKKKEPIVGSEAAAVKKPEVKQGDAAEKTVKKEATAPPQPPSAPSSNPNPNPMASNAKEESKLPPSNAPSVKRDLEGEKEGNEGAPRQRQRLEYVPPPLPPSTSLAGANTSVSRSLEINRTQARAPFPPPRDGPAMSFREEPRQMSYDQRGGSFAQAPIIVERIDGRLVPTVPSRPQVQSKIQAVNQSEERDNSGPSRVVQKAFRGIFPAPLRDQAGKHGEKVPVFGRIDQVRLQANKRDMEADEAPSQEPVAKKQVVKIHVEAAPQERQEVAQDRQGLPQERQGVPQGGLGMAHGGRGIAQGGRGRGRGRGPGPGPGAVRPQMPTNPAAAPHSSTAHAAPAVPLAKKPRLDGADASTNAEKIMLVEALEAKRREIERLKNSFGVPLAPGGIK